MKNLCPKGRNCNFLHIFKNPRNQFPINNALRKSALATAVVGANGIESRYLNIISMSILSHIYSETNQKLQTVGMRMLTVNAEIGDGRRARTERLQRRRHQRTRHRQPEVDIEVRAGIRSG